MVTLSPEICRDPLESGADRWLSGLGQDRVVRVPGLLDRNSTHADWRQDVPAGLDEHLLYYVVSGSFSATVGGARWTLEPGAVAWIRPHTPLTVSTPEDQRTVLYQFRLAPDAVTDADLVPAVHISGAWEVRGLFDLLVGELLAPGLPHQGERVKGLLLVLFTTLLRRAAQSTEPGVFSLSTRKAIEKYADDHITGRPTVADLAAVAGLSPDYFTRTFRKTFGMPPREWLVRRRIEHAAVLLDESGKSIAQVATAYGYQDGFLFSRQFKTVMGVPPQAYRAR
ncbi:AraC family transcriptional regulator [Streptomyces sp. NPDC051014]|uniref:helix-turn-helix domain-containing protein n=1 Tax=Streptomyces sp. NPDC051014 TaxID=3155751 RepID=UPI0033CC3D01